MPEELQRLLKVFLCHAHEDKPAVRELYKYLRAKGVHAWLDENELLPGQDFDAEIMKALQESDAIIICLSKTSVSREGYVQREIKEALDTAREKPSGTIFVIPAKLNDCKVPNYLKNWHWVELFSENGYERLMLSLQTRAKAVGAVINPTPVEDFVDEELENELKRLYFEGRGAFLIENWDKAINRFNRILNERPNYPGIAGQLAEAERQKVFAKLYTEGKEAYQARDWEHTIKVLVQLLHEFPDYKDAPDLLEDAKRQKRVVDLYREAQQLYMAKEWKAVITIFQEIHRVDPNFLDTENLLFATNEELEKLKREDELNTLYGQAVYKMEAGNWHEARDLLKKIQESEPDFLDSEGLLAKIEAAIKEAETKQRINTLYEEADKLAQSRMWEQALDKLSKIRELDKKFSDPAQIAKQAQTALQSAALYSEAVSLMRERKYQDALEKWHEVLATDPKYPDPHKVESISKRKLAELTKSPKSGWNKVGGRQAGIVSSIVIVLVLIIWGFYRFLPIPSVPLAATETPISPATATRENKLTSADYGKLVYNEEFDNTVDTVKRWDITGSRVLNGDLILAPSTAAYPFKFGGERARYTDFILESGFANPDGSQSMSFYVRFNDSSCTNCSIQVSIDFSYKTIVGRRVKGANSYIDITSKSIQIDQSHWQKITIKVKGSDYTVYINDAFVMSFTDSTYTSGSFVLDNYGPKAVKVDYIHVYSLP